MILLFPLAYAASEPPITLDRAVAIALASGVDAAEARLAVDAARTEVHTRAHAGLPDLALDLAASATLADTFDADAARNVATPGASTTARVQSTLPLVAGGRLRADRAAAEATLDAARATLERTEQDLRYTLACALLDLAEARGERALADARLDAEKALQVQIAAWVSVGTRTRADALQQDAVVAGVEHDRALAEAAVATDELALVQALRLDPAQAWTFVPPDAPPPTTSVPDGERADVRAAAAAVDTATAEVRAARSGGRPAADLALGASTAWDTASAGALPAQLRDDARAWATVDLSIPVFDRSVTRDAVEAARIAERDARLRLDAARTDADADRTRARLDASTAASALAAAERRQQAAAGAASVTAERYAAGAAAVYELQAARAAVADADLAVLQARIAVLRAAFERRWADGA